MPLTDAQIKQLKPEKDTGKHFDGEGMYLEVTAAGGKYWRLKYRFGGKENRISFGVYPTVTLAEARRKRTAAKEMIRRGIDPSQSRKIEKLTIATSAENTFESLALDWHKTKAPGWAASHAQKTLERMTKNVFPWIGQRPLSELKPPELLACLKRIESRGAIETTRRVQQIMSAVFSFAIATGRAENNPARDIGAAITTKVTGGNHPAILEPVRFGAMLRDIETYTGSYITKAALQIHALTCQRPNEVSGMRWDEIDLDQALWTIPAARMKGTVGKKQSGAPHLVPLARQAIAVLKDLQPLTGDCGLVFPSERGQGRTISENTARQALRTMGYTDHTPHGFRATLRTMAEELLHFKREVVERYIAHGSREALGSAYDRTQFMQERLRLVQAWADYMDVLRTGGNVVQLSKAA